MKKRDIGKEILEGIRDIKRGKGKRYIVNMPKAAHAHRTHLCGAASGGKTSKGFIEQHSFHITA